MLNACTYWRHFAIHQILITVSDFNFANMAKQLILWIRNMVNPLIRNVVKWSDMLLNLAAVAARFLECVEPLYDIAKWRVKITKTQNFTPAKIYPSKLFWIVKGELYRRNPACSNQNQNCFSRIFFEWRILIELVCKKCSRIALARKAHLFKVWSQHGRLLLCQSAMTKGIWKVVMNW